MKCVCLQNMNCMNLLWCYSTNFFLKWCMGWNWPPYSPLGFNMHLSSISYLTMLVFNFSKKIKEEHFLRNITFFNDRMHACMHACVCVCLYLYRLLNWSQPKAYRRAHACVELNAIKLLWKKVRLGRNLIFLYCILCFFQPPREPPWQKVPRFV